MIGISNNLATMVLSHYTIVCVLFFLLLYRARLMVRRLSSHRTARPLRPNGAQESGTQENHRSPMAMREQDYPTFLLLEDCINLTDFWVVCLWPRGHANSA